MTPIRLNGEGGTITIEPDATDACIVQCRFTTYEQQVDLGRVRVGSFSRSMGHWLELADSITYYGAGEHRGNLLTLVLNFGPLRYSLYGTIRCPERVLVVNDGRGPVKDVGAIRLSHQQVEDWKRELEALASALKWGGGPTSPFFDSVSVTPLRVEGEGGSLVVEPDANDPHFAHCRFQGSGEAVNLGRMRVAQIPISMKRWLPHVGSGALPVAGTLGGNSVTLVMGFPPPGYSLYGTVGGPQWVLHIVDSSKSPQEEVGAIRLSKEQQWEWSRGFGYMCDILKIY